MRRVPKPCQTNNYFIKPGAVGNSSCLHVLEQQHRVKMNVKFKYFAIFIAFALRRIEAVEFQNDAGSSRRRLIDSAPVGQPTFSPVDIRIPIGFVPNQIPSEEESPAESEPVQTDPPITTHDDSPEITESPTKTPSVPSVSIDPIETEIETTPEDRPTQGSNWCPTYFSGNGNACGSNVPSEASWIQCAYSESNHLQTCVCSESDPFWRCKSNKPNSDAFVIVTTKPSVDSNTGIQTAEPIAPVENSSSEELGSSSMPQIDSTGTNKVPSPSSAPESNTSVTVAGDEPASQSSSEAVDNSFSTTPNDSTGANETSNPSPPSESNTSAEVNENESSNESSSGAVGVSSSTTPDDSTGANEISDPSPTSESNTSAPTAGDEPHTQASSGEVGSSSSTTPDDSTQSDASIITTESDPDDVDDLTESPTQALKGPGLPSPVLPHDSTETETETVPTPSTSTESDSTRSDEATESPSQAFRATGMPLSTPQVDPIETDKLLNPSPAPEATTSTMDITNETPDESTSKAVETSLADEDSTAIDSPIPSKESDTESDTEPVAEPVAEPVTETTELQNTNSTPSTDVSKTMSPSSAYYVVPVRVPTSAPIPMPVDWSSIVKSNHPVYKETENYQIASPVVAPSTPPSPTISLTQKLPPGIFATRRTDLPTTMPTASIAGDTSACRKASSTDRRILVFRYLRSLSGENAFDDVEDPAFMAASWISDEDPLQLCPGDQNFTQRYVLALLYFYTSGDNWKRCTRYPTRECFGERFLSDFDECSWGGVTCDSQNRVTKLNLGKSFSVFLFSLCESLSESHSHLFFSLVSDENNLSGSIPQELSYLEYLFELDFDSNNLIGHFPSWVGAMKHLERLDLDRNILSGPIPEELYTSTSLKYVDMDRNILSGTISSNIGTMSQLIFFQVDFNQLIGTIPTEIANITDLQYFSVFGNGFDESVGIPFEICGFHTQIYANCEMCEKVGDCCAVCLPADLSDFF